MTHNNFENTNNFSLDKKEWWFLVESELNKKNTEFWLDLLKNEIVFWEFISNLDLDDKEDKQLYTNLNYTLEKNLA